MPHRLSLNSQAQVAFHSSGHPAWPALIQTTPKDERYCLHLSVARDRRNLRHWVTQSLPKAEQWTNQGLKPDSPDFCLPYLFSILLSSSLPSPMHLLSSLSLGMWENAGLSLCWGSISSLNERDLKSSHHSFINVDFSTQRLVTSSEHVDCPYLVFPGFLFLPTYLSNSHRTNKQTKQPKVPAEWTQLVLM